MLAHWTGWRTYPMELLIGLLVVLVVFGLLSLFYGVDSRDDRDNPKWEW